MAKPKKSTNNTKTKSLLDKYYKPLQKKLKTNPISIRPQEEESKFNSFIMRNIMTSIQQDHKLENK